MPLRDSIKDRLDHSTLGKVDMFEQMLYELVHHSAGGLGSVAARSGYTMAEGLANEVCPTNRGFKFGALELFVVLSKVSKRDRERFMDGFDRLLERDQCVSSASVVMESIMSQLAQLGKEQNDVTTVVFSALEDDGRFDDLERLAVIKELDDVVERANLTKTALLNGAGVDGNS